MSRYHLSEAYASIYNPRLDEDFNDNLHFIEYMLDEDIEEVVESLFWEFRDYGYSIDEAIELLRVSASTEVINESLEVLTENRFNPRDRTKVRSKQQADREATDTMIRRNKRKARIDGAISKVKAAWEGAKGGLGKAAQAIKGAPGKASEFVSQQRQNAKAKLQKLMRTGKAKVERFKRDVTGETGRTQAMRSRKQYEKNKDRRSEANRSSVGNAFEGPRKSSSPAERDPWAGNYSSGPSTTKKSSSGGRVLSGSSPRAALPPAKEAPENSRRKAATLKANKAAKGSQSRGKRFAPPSGSGVTGASAKRANTDYRRAASRFAKSAGLADSYAYELLDIVIEDLINEGYAANEYDALNIINTLNEDTLYDITQEYLFG